MDDREKLFDYECFNCNADFRTTHSDIDDFDGLCPSCHDEFEKEYRKRQEHKKSSHQVYLEAARAIQKKDESK